MAVVSEREGKITLEDFLPRRMSELLGMDGYGLPIGAFRGIREGIGRNYNRWTKEILDSPIVEETLVGAKTIVELGCGHEASMTKIVTELVQKGGGSIQKAVLFDIDPTVSGSAINSLRENGLEEVVFERLDLRTEEGLGKLRALGGPNTVVTARALLNQLGRGADVIVRQVFPAFEMGVVLDIAHPEDHPGAWVFSAADPNNMEAQQRVKDANNLFEVHYGLLRADGRQLPGAQLKTLLEGAGLPVVHHKVVPEDPGQEFVTDLAFADAPRLTAVVVALSLIKKKVLPIDPQELDQLLVSYDQVLEAIQDGKVRVTTVQFGGAVWKR